MTDHLRPPESASIDGDLRTRMEGKVELLEDGIHLLDTVVDALNRAELDDDDLRTLQEVINQLPRINEALDALLKHEAASQLTAKFAQRTRWLQDALMLKLKSEQPPPSLRAGLSMVLQQAQLAPHAPREGETRLLQGAPSQGLAVLLAIFGAVIPTAVWSQPFLLLLGPVIYAIATRLRRQEPSWTLLPDRLHLTESDSLEREIGFSSIDSVKVLKAFVLVQSRGEAKLIGAPDPHRLASWLELLRSPWLANLEAKPRAFGLCTARNRDTNETGLALVVRDGVLFIPTDRLRLALEAITPHPLGAPPTREAFLQLLAHVPEGRWNALGEHLARSCDGAWLARGASLDDSSGEFLTLSGTQRSDDGPADSTRGRWALAQLQLSFTLDARGLAERQRIAALLQ